MDRFGQQGVVASGGGRGRPLGANLERLILDSRFALRSHRRSPLFALVAVAIVALGVGATTTIYSVVDAVLLKALPYPDAHRLVLFDHGSHSPLDFKAWRDRTSSFSAIAAGWGSDVDLTADGSPERLRAARITPRFLRASRGSLRARARLRRRGVCRRAAIGASRPRALAARLWRRPERYGTHPRHRSRTRHHRREC